MECFDIRLDEQVAGRVTVHKEGLYYRISCICRLPQSGVYRLTAQCPDREIPLGILVPESDSFVLHTRIAVKKFSTTPTGFSVVPHEDTKKMRFVPLHTDTPFDHISDLEYARLSLKDGKIGIILGQLPV